MAVDRKSLRQRMKEAREDAQVRCKHIRFPLPDLKGPGGNAFTLLATADKAMKDAGIPEATRSLFRSEATSGDYTQVLATLQKWFTLQMADTKYVDIPEGFDITTLKPGSGDEEDWSQFDVPADESATDVGLDEALDDYEHNAERDRKIAEVQDKINREVRAELGLEDDDVVIVQVKKAKKKGGQ